tara:strand:+ start:724 stop:1389 length:666 start_codon:yes stop_codon:yes gene_type:complete
MSDINENPTEVNISDCNNFLKVGIFKLNHSSTKCLWTCDFCIDEEKLRDDRGRCYAIVVDGIIKKIGLTDDSAGIRKIAGYCSGNGGTPSKRTTGIHYYIGKELLNGKVVELWCIWAPLALVSVPGLSAEDNKDGEFSIRSKELEKNCIDNYKERTGGRLPEWNMQEAGRTRDWPQLIIDIMQSLPESRDYLPMPENIDEADDLLKLYHWKFSGYNLFPDQ